MSRRLLDRWWAILAIFASCSSLRGDEYNLPVYHVTAAADSKAWLGDPIPFYLQGVYHVFQQIGRHPNPRGNRWRHLASDDLLNWRDQGDAWQPTADYPEFGRVFTGSIFCRGDEFHALYTNDSRRLIHAVSPDLTHWERVDYPTNEIALPSPYLFFWNDPHVFQVEGECRMVTGAYLPEKVSWAWQGTPCFVEMRSFDLKKWEVVRELVRGTEDHPLFTSECPDYFTLGDRQILIGSAPLPVQQQNGAQQFTYAYISRDAAGNFRPQDRTAVDAGGIVYAGKTLLDDRDRRIFFGWIMDLPSPSKVSEHSAERGWSGVLSLPRVMTLAADGTLRWNPPRELESLRDKQWSFPSNQLQTLRAEDMTILADPKGDALEIVARIRPTAEPKGDPFGVIVRAAADGSAGTRITVDPASKTLIVSNRGDIEPDLHTMSAAVTLSADRDFLLQIFVDRSVIEVFADKRQCITTRAYARHSEKNRIGVLLPTSSVATAELDVWSVRPVSIERPR